MIVCYEKRERTVEMREKRDREYEWSRRSRALNTLDLHCYGLLGSLDSLHRQQKKEIFAFGLGRFCGMSVLVHQ